MKILSIAAMASLAASVYAVDLMGALTVAPCPQVVTVLDAGYPAIKTDAWQRFSGAGMMASARVFDDDQPDVRLIRLAQVTEVDAQMTLLLRNAVVATPRRGDRVGTAAPRPVP